MINPPSLIVISGHPASGKTTLARWLAPQIRLPLFERDALKETLYDTLGWSDRAWSRRLGAASVALLFQVIEAQLAAGGSCVAESNFFPAFDEPRFAGLLERHPARLLQLHCRADDATLLERFRRRALSGERHPGHVDHGSQDEFAERLREPAPPLALPGATIIIDTGDPAGIDRAALLEQIRAWLAAPAND
ncbi:MAG TPA: AAA family ATPase [Herpetosiphonaceae bacterium]